MLFIAPVMPDEGGNGLAMRQGQFLAAYAREFDVDLAVIPLAGPAAADDGFARRHARRLIVFALGGMNTHAALLARLRDPAARLAAFKAYGRPGITARLTGDVIAQFHAWIAGQNYDLVHTGRLYLLSLSAAMDAPRIADADEDDARVFRQIAARRSGPEAAWAAAEAENAMRETAAFLPAIGHVFTASQVDATALTRLSRAVTVIPNAAARRWPVAVRMDEQRLLFVGALGYQPNAGAVEWFIKKCWPRLHKSRPRLRFDVVGGGAPAGLRRLAMRPGIIRHGWQKDLRRFYASAGVVIVPVLVGGGSRIKLLEAASYGRAIVATTAGAQGSLLTPKRDFNQADGAHGFAKAVMAALARPHRLGRAALKAVARNHDAARLQQKILAVAKAIASAGPA